MAAEKENKTANINSSSHHHHQQQQQNHHHHQYQEEYCEPCRSFGQKCSHLVKKQRAKFYILRRCIAMLVCWRDRGDP